MVTVTAKENAKDSFRIPVSWRVSDIVKVEADSIEEALAWVKANVDEIPINYDDCDYIDDSYSIDVDTVEELTEYNTYLVSYGM